MTRIIIQSGHHAAITLDLSGAGDAPIHLHLGEHLASAPLVPVGQIAPSKGSFRRRLLTWGGVGCAMLAVAIGVNVIKVGPSSAMPPSLMMPQLPVGSGGPMAYPLPQPSPTMPQGGPAPTRYEPAPVDPKAAILEALQHPALPDETQVQQRKVEPSASPAPAARGSSPFGLEN